MPRYLVERRFPGGLAIPANLAGAEACLRVVRENAAVGVTWLQSFVSADLETMVCVYEGPDEDAIRTAAAAVEGIRLVETELVWQPEWHSGMIAPNAW